MKKKKDYHFVGPSEIQSWIWIPVCVFKRFSSGTICGVCVHMYYAYMYVCVYAYGTFKSKIQYRFPCCLYEEHKLQVGREQSAQ